MGKSDREQPGESAVELPLNYRVRDLEVGRGRQKQVGFVGVLLALEPRNFQKNTCNSGLLVLITEFSLL